MMKDFNGNSSSILVESGERFGIMGGGPLAQAIMFPLFEKGIVILVEILSAMFSV